MTREFVQVTEEKGGDWYLGRKLPEFVFRFRDTKEVTHPVAVVGRRATCLHHPKVNALQFAFGLAGNKQLGCKEITESYEELFSKHLFVNKRSLFVDRRPDVPVDDCLVSVLSTMIVAIGEQLEIGLLEAERLLFAIPELADKEEAVMEKIQAAPIKTIEGYISYWMLFQEGVPTGLDYWQFVSSLDISSKADQWMIRLLEEKFKPSWIERLVIEEEKEIEKRRWKEVVRKYLFKEYDIFTLHNLKLKKNAWPLDIQSRTVIPTTISKEEREGFWEELHRNSSLRELVVFLFLEWVHGGNAKSQGSWENIWSAAKSAQELEQLLGVYSYKNTVQTGEASSSAPPTTMVEPKEEGWVKSGLMDVRLVNLAERLQQIWPEAGRGYLSYVINQKVTGVDKHEILEKIQTGEIEQIKDGEWREFFTGNTDENLPLPLAASDLDSRGAIYRGMDSQMIRMAAPERWYRVKGIKKYTPAKNNKELGL